MPTARFLRALTLFSVLAVLVAACGGNETATSTTEAVTTTAAPEPTTTTVPPTTTSTAEPTRLEQLSYPVSNEWVVETVVSDIAAGTGGLAVAEDGTMYQADFGWSIHPGDRVYRISPGGEAEVFVESEDMASNTMTTFGADGQLYQSSYGSGRVWRIAEDGTLTLIADDIDGPTGIVGLEDGTLFVEAFNAGIIHKILPDGTIEDFVVRASGFNGINGLASGPDGTLYVANFRDGGLFAVDPDGTVTELNVFPRATSHVAYLDGSLFVTSRGGFVVYRYDLETGEAEIIAGNAEPGEADGRGTESSFGRPNAITVGPDGALYFNHADGQKNSPVHVKRITHQP